MFGFGYNKKSKITVFFLFFHFIPLSQIVLRVPITVLCKSFSGINFIMQWYCGCKRAANKSNQIERNPVRSSSILNQFWIELVRNWSRVSNWKRRVHFLLISIHPNNFLYKKWVVICQSNLFLRPNKWLLIYLCWQYKLFLGSNLEKRIKDQIIKSSS